MGFQIRNGISIGRGAEIELDDGVNTESITLDIGWYSQAELQAAINAALAASTHFSGVTCALGVTAVFSAAAAFTLQVLQPDLGEYLGFGATISPSATSHTASAGSMAIRLVNDAEPWTFRRRYTDRAAQDFAGVSARPAYDHSDLFTVPLWATSAAEINHLRAVLERAQRGTFQWAQGNTPGAWSWADADIGGFLWGQLAEPEHDLRQMEQSPRADIRRITLDIIGWEIT